MSTDILNKLQTLQKNSNKRLSPVVKTIIHDNSKPRALVKSVLVANGNYATVPVKGAPSLTTSNNTDVNRRVRTFTAGSEHIVDKLNKDLLGGESYPILTTALGIATGAVSAGAGLVFTLANTGLSLANTASKVLARPGDEIWHHEKIGKEGDKIIYVSAFFIVDPYRRTSSTKGWLIHEEREEISLS